MGAFTSVTYGIKSKDEVRKVVDSVLQTPVSQMCHLAMSPGVSRHHEVDPAQSVPPAAHKYVSLERQAASSATSSVGEVRRHETQSLLTDRRRSDNLTSMQQRYPLHRRFEHQFTTTMRNGRSGVARQIERNRQRSRVAQFGPDFTFLHL